MSAEPQGTPAPGEDAITPSSPNVTALAVRKPPEAREIRVVTDPIPVLDTARFEHMQRIATVMASGSLVPDCLCKDKDGNALQGNVIVANCFLVVNQAVRWGMDPFAVAQCVSLVHGKFCYEGKLIAAAIDSRLNIRLAYKFNDGKGQDLGVTVSGTMHGEAEPREIFGRVKDWHRGPKSPWADEGAWQRQLRYRGAREWCRAHAPGVIMGVYAPDEFEDAPRPIHAAPTSVAPRALKVATAPLDVPDLEVIEPLADEAGFLSNLEEELRGCGKDAALRAEVWSANEHMAERLSADGQKRMRKLEPAE